jgi:glutaredoxin 3
LARVTIYTRHWCGYCVAAVRLLEKRGIAFEHIDVTGNTNARAWLADATGQSTVPQIFVDDRPIGGYRELRALDRDGDLDRMLRGIDNA